MSHQPPTLPWRHPAGEMRALPNPVSGNLQLLEHLLPNALFDSNPYGMSLFEKPLLDLPALYTGASCQLCIMYISWAGLAWQ